MPLDQIPILRLFAKPSRAEVAELRDEIITLRTQVVFASSMLETLKHQKRREVRRDAFSYRQALKDTTARLSRSLGRGDMGKGA